MKLAAGARGKETTDSTQRADSVQRGGIHRNKQVLMREIFSAFFSYIVILFSTLVLCAKKVTLYMYLADLSFFCFVGSICNEQSCSMNRS